MIAALSFSRHRQLTLFALLFLSTSLVLHWGYSGSHYASSRGTGRISGLGLLPSRWSVKSGRIRGGPGAAWGIDRQRYTYTVPLASVGGGDEERIEGVEGQEMRKMGLHDEQAGHEEEPAAWSVGADQVVLELDSHDILRRTREVWAKCREEDEFERYFGRTNLRLSRAYEGSCSALQCCSRARRCAVPPDR